MNAVVILGAGGQVGRALHRLLMTQQGRPVRALGRSGCDITDPAAVERAIADSSVVVNCAAYTAVDQAENESDLVYNTNMQGSAIVATACQCARIPIPLIQLSTDYVFDGTGAKPWCEDDRPNPINVYGRSKLAGETAVRERFRKHIILRTSWVFSAWGQNFVKTIRRLASTRGELRVVDDQMGGPTSASDIARGIAMIIDRADANDFTEWGTYHFCGAPAVSWHEFAREIVQGTDAKIIPIPTSDYPTPAPRPRYSVLDCEKIVRQFGIAQPDWREALRVVLRELHEAP